MRPAFFSTKSAAAFVVLAAAMLLLPAVSGRKFLPAREQAFANAAENSGAYAWIHRQIFQEKSDVDIAVMGSSLIFNGIDTPYVQQALSQKLGRPAVVITLGWFWAGFDADFFIAQDLLKHRRVRMLVVYDEGTRADNPHPRSPIWFRWGENARDLAGLPLGYQAALYTGAVMGMPRNLLSCARADLAVNPQAEDYWQNLYQTSGPAEHLGAVLAHRPFINGEKFFRYQPAQVATNSAAVYSAARRDDFEFNGPATGNYQLHFARALATFAQTNGIKLVFVHLPRMENTGSPVVAERENWPAILPGAPALVGVPPARLFAGLTPEEISRLYCNDHHFNENGAEFFARQITPALLQLYETADRR